MEKIVESYDYAHDSNRLLAVEKQQDNKTTERVLSYDAVGNVVNDSRSAEQNLALIYGANNRLQSIEGKAVYTHNAKGQRVLKRVTQEDGSVKTTHFHYNQFDQLIAETDGEGQVLKEYLYSNAERIALVDYAGKQAGQLVYIHNDHLGTPQLMTGAGMQVVWREEVMPFGESLAANDAGMKLKFPGQYFDEESGFRQNYFRDYDPSLGRYLQSDPIGLRGGEIKPLGHPS